MSNAVAFVRGIIPSVDRQKDDFYPTPPEATEALLGKEIFTGPVWEPACGDGAISRVLIAHGHTVVSSDLIDRGYGTPRVDFLMETRPQAPNIITNPPFKHALPFLIKALALTDGKVVFLCRLAWLEGIERGAMFRSTPLARVWVCSRRVRMNRGGESLKKTGSMLAFAWFVWEHGYQGAPTLGWITPENTPRKPRRAANDNPLTSPADLPLFAGLA